MVMPLVLLRGGGGMGVEQGLTGGPSCGGANPPLLWQGQGVKGRLSLGGWDGLSRSTSNPCPIHPICSQVLTVWHPLVLLCLAFCVS